MSGVQFVAQGIRLVLGSRKFFPYVWRPLLKAAILFVLLVLGCWLVLIPSLSAYLNSRAGQFGSIVGMSAGTVLYVVLIWYTAGVLFTTLAITISAFGWEELSHRIEQEVYGDSVRPELNLPRIAMDTAMRMTHMSIVMCASLGCFFIPFSSVIFAGWLCAHDLTAPAMVRRGILFHRQTGRVLKTKGMLAFALISGILVTIPFVNVIMMPCLVAAGTLMVAANDGKKPIAQESSS